MMNDTASLQSAPNSSVTAASLREEARRLLDLADTLRARLAAAAVWIGGGR